MDSVQHAQRCFFGEKKVFGAFGMLSSPLEMKEWERAIAALVGIS